MWARVLNLQTVSWKCFILVYRLFSFCQILIDDFVEITPGGKYKDIKAKTPKRIIELCSFHCTNELLVIYRK